MSLPSHVISHMYTICLRNQQVCRRAKIDFVLRSPSRAPNHLIVIHSIFPHIATAEKLTPTNPPPPQKKKKTTTTTTSEKWCFTATATSVSHSKWSNPLTIDFVLRSLSWGPYHVIVIHSIFPHILFDDSRITMREGGFESWMSLLETLGGVGWATMLLRNPSFRT